MNSSKNQFHEKTFFLLCFLQLCFLLTNIAWAQDKPINDQRHKYFNEVINGVKLYYHIFTVDPQKPYVFFLHGGPGGNCVDSETLFPFLTGDKVNWVFMDQRGGGRSANFRLDPSLSELKLEQVTPDLMVEDIEQIRLKHNLGKMIIYGHSWGGNLGAYYTYAHPESLLGYILTSNSHNWKKNSENLLNRNIYFVGEVDRVLKNWLKNGYTAELFYHLPQLRILFDAQGNQDIIDIISKKETMNNTLTSRIEKIIENNKNIETKLIALSQTEYSTKKMFNTLTLTSSLGSYGNLNTPDIQEPESTITLPIKPNDVLKAWSDLSPKDNIWYYPQFKVPGAFWCGAYDIWNGEAMIQASKLAPNSTYFVFPRSGHVYQTSEPLLFVRKLLEEIDILTGKKKENTLISRKIWPQLTGKFTNETFGECEVVIDGENLMASVAGIKIILEPVDEIDFIMHGGPGNGGKLTFEKDKDGNYTKFVGKGYVFERVTKEIVSGTNKDNIDRSLWPAFEGDFYYYYNNKMGQCKIAIEGDYLIGTLMGGRILLEPISKNEFQLQLGPGNKETLSMSLDKDGTLNVFYVKGIKFTRVKKD